MPQKIRVKDFFKTLASKSRTDGQTYLKELREQMDVKSFAEAHELGLFSNKKFTRANAIRLDKYADEGTVMAYNNVRVLRDYPRGKAGQVVPEDPDDPDVAPLTPEQEKQVDEVSKVKDMDDARTVAEDTAKRLSEEAFRKRAEEVAKEIAERLTKEAFAKKKAGELGKSVFNARKVAQEVADRLSKDAMEIADTTAVAEAKAKEKRDDVGRTNPKASQRDKTEEREYAREDTNKEQRAKEVNKRRQALDRWSNDPQADTDVLLEELGFKKRQIEDNTDAQVKRAKKTLADYSSAELTEDELFEMMDMLIDPPADPPTQSPDERDAKPKAKQDVSSSGERRPMAERPVFRADAKRQSEEAVQADKKALSMQKQQKKERDQRKARDAKVQQARSNMRQEVEVSASGGGVDDVPMGEAPPLPPSPRDDNDSRQPPQVRATATGRRVVPPPTDTPAGTGSGLPKPSLNPPGVPTKTQGVRFDPEAFEEIKKGFQKQSGTSSGTPRNVRGDTPRMETTGTDAWRNHVRSHIRDQDPNITGDAYRQQFERYETDGGTGYGRGEPVALAPTKAELIPKERLTVEGKSTQELAGDITYFFKNFASQLKPIKAKWNKLSKSQKSNEAVLKRYHGEIVGRLQPEGSKAGEGKEGTVGIVVDAEQYIEMKMREIMLDARFANMQPAELVDVNEGIKKKQASDMGAFEVRQGLRGGKSFIQREPVYKAISTSQPDQLAVQMRPAGKATQPKRLSLMPAKQINLATTAKKFNSANPFARSVPTITFQVLK